MEIKLPRPMPLLEAELDIAIEDRVGGLAQLKAGLARTDAQIKRLFLLAHSCVQNRMETEDDETKDDMLITIEALNAGGETLERLAYDVREKAKKLGIIV